MKKIFVYGVTAILVYECVAAVCNIAANTVIAVANGVAKVVEKKKVEKAQNIGKKTKEGYIETCFVD